MIEFLTIICLGLGAFFVFTSALGLLRMPDFFTRLHPAGIGDSIGLPLILLGLLLNQEFGLISFKIFLLIIFSLVTSATASHALAKAALMSGVKPLGVSVPNKKTKKAKKK